MPPPHKLFPLAVRRVQLAIAAGNTHIGIGDAQAIFTEAFGTEVAQWPAPDFDAERANQFKVADVSEALDEIFTRPGMAVILKPHGVELPATEERAPSIATIEAPPTPRAKPRADSGLKLEDHIAKYGTDEELGADHPGRMVASLSLTPAQAHALVKRGFRKVGDLQEYLATGANLEDLEGISMDLATRAINAIHFVRPIGLDTPGRVSPRTRTKAAGARTPATTPEKTPEAEAAAPADDAGDADGEPAEEAQE